MLSSKELGLRIKQVLENEESAKKWNYMGQSEWTRYVSGVVQTLFADVGFEACCKHRSDAEGRSEYLCIDVMGYERVPSGYGRPVAICESENSLDVRKIGYCLWKLFSVRAQVRILIAYFNPNARSQFHPNDPDTLMKALAENVGNEFAASGDAQACALIAKWPAEVFEASLYAIEGGASFRA